MSLSTPTDERRTVLVVEDERDLRTLISYNLAKAGYAVEEAGSGELAVKKARLIEPDLVVLDLMLPGMDGLEVCRTLRADPQTAGVSIVMLTAKGDEADIVLGLEMGADDYIVKPFAPRVLLARIKAAMRRRQVAVAGDDAPLSAGPIRIHPGKHEALLDDRPLSLTQLEFRLLLVLAQRRGWVLTRRQLLDATHQAGEGVTERSIDVQIVGLRKKLGDSGDQVETVRGVGYRLRA